jgi:isopentenyl diphosphate isomerase/L-lactate dehydrogenase-like FMN-dependent dehydrogenase
MILGAAARDALTIADLRRIARRKVPRAVFDFIDGGAEDEITLRENRAAFERLRLLPLMLADVHEVNLGVTVAGQRLTAPIILAPTGLCGMARPRGEVSVARAASRAGIPFVVSCMSAVSWADLVREVPATTWCQIYIWRNRDAMRSLLERALELGFEVLVTTVDVPVIGQRERDHRNDVTVPPRITLRNAIDVMRRPRWLAGLLFGPPVEYANLTDGRRGKRPFALSQWVNREFDPAASWADVERIRTLWPRRLFVKGILAPADAKRALAIGVDGVVVSNHGGRQLDGAIASLDALRAVADAVGGSTELVLDGGVRRGSDILKALALGARACMVGRPYLYGLAAAGEQGVARAIEILTAELRRAMALSGVRSTAEISAGLIAESSAPVAAPSNPKRLVGLP